MLKNYFKIACRNLWRNKGFSAITIAGLAIGLATCLLIALYVTDELQYDRFNTRADRIYRIDADFLVNGSAFNERFAPAAFAGVLQKDYPQIEQTVRLVRQEDVLVKKGNETVIEHNGLFADSTLFKVFSLSFIAGDAKTALTQPNTAVIAESMAKKYFGSTDVLGKQLLLNNTEPYTVSGVIKDMPAQSHVHFNIIRAMAGFDDSRAVNWMSDNYVTYLLARPGTTEADLNGFLRAATKKYMESALVKMTGSDIETLEKKGGHFRYNVIPLSRIHLYSPIVSEAEPAGNAQYVYIFIVVAVVILLIACVNFMNLSTARSAGRAREVGVRKVLGSLRVHLIVQFLSESVLSACIALVLALLLAALGLPYLNLLADKHITLQSLNWGIWLPALLLLTLLVAVIAGSYPAFFLSSFQPVQVLKGKLAAGFKGSWLRNSLVVFQFAAAIILIAGTLVIYNQLHYIRNKQVGYNRDQVLVLQNTSSLWIHAKSFKQQVLQIPGVKAGTMTGFIPTTNIQNTNVYSKDAAHSGGQVMGLDEWSIDADYIPTLGMQLVQGRNFSPLLPTDTTQSIIINETAARLLGFKEPLNKKLYNDGAFTIIGVVKDFNAGSLKNEIPPLLFRLTEDRMGMAFRINAQNATAIINEIERKFHAEEKMAGQPFLYSFLDEDFNRLYKSEQRTGSIFTSFALLAIFIACLGVFGLVTYAAEQRTKEIGVRKVLGASVSTIVGLLSKDFIKLVAISIVIATPIAWFMMHQWLQGFAYRVGISWWIFAVSAFAALFITMATVSFRAVKAALLNPVTSLRTE